LSLREISYLKTERLDDVLGFSDVEYLSPFIFSGSTINVVSSSMVLEVSFSNMIF